MNRTGLCVAVSAVLCALGVAPVVAQQGVESDWSNHHVKFTQPEPESKAYAEGRHDAWQSFVNQPRYRTQELKRSKEWSNRFAEFDSDFVESKAQQESDFRVLGRHHEKTEMNRDWTAQIAPTGSGVAAGMYPAGYGASYTTASCSDYVVFPVNRAGANSGTKQANLVALNNLYKTTCASSGSIPTVKFSYYISTGSVLTSPVISEDGTKVAFVVSVTNGATFDVLTLDTTGKGNGTAYNAPVVPGTGNNAKLTSLTLNGNRSVTYSSPFVDIDDDIAYVGDNSGYLHKFTCVFNRNSSTCKTAEATTGGWPFHIGSITNLSGPVYDSTSGNVYLGAGNGYVYCVNLNKTAPAACTTAREGVANGTGSDAIETPPVVTSNGTVSWVFSQGNQNGSNEYVMQVPTSATAGFGTPAYASLGVSVYGESTLYSGDFDNAYYNASAGQFANTHLYFCGFASYDSSYEEPTLFQIGFNAAGAMNTSATQGPRLSKDYSDNTDECTPLTEVYNGTTDYMFLGVNDEGSPTQCNSEACVMSFTLGSTFNTSLAPTAAISLGKVSTSAASGISIDNVSTSPGASEIYFGNMITGNATQATQAGLN